MKLILTYLILLTTNLFAEGGFDKGTSAGKGNVDISITINPLNYFDQGQSYIMLGYGLTNNFDIHGYFSRSKENIDNYYLGLFYQFLDREKLDLATAFGYRQIKGYPEKHIFYPQLLYSIYINTNISLGGSFVNIKDSNLYSIGYASDIFITKKLYSNNKINIGFTIGAFNPVFWKPKNGNWHPTYSFDIKIIR
tara:strand:- start:11885 stop:12466 length:582 start_codon:yes stop_codon:yes gene_type:complete